MRILLLTFYYPPDVGPGSLRAKSITEALLAVGHQEVQIDVLTTMPNRYHSLEVTAPLKEKIGPVFITRLKLAEHRNGMVDQAFAFFQYARAVREHLHCSNRAIVVATSSRLMTASLAAWE